jgi:hypothetical protein
MERASEKFSLVKEQQSPNPAVHNHRVFRWAPPRLGAAVENMRSSDQPAPRTIWIRPPRWFFPLTVGVITFGLVWAGYEADSLFTDFEYFWAGGVALSQGLDPYAYIQDRIADAPLRSPFYYPATAAVFMAPFGVLSRQAAAALFTATGMVLLAWSVTGWRQWIVLSAPAVQAVLFGQWSPWLTAAIGLPWLGLVWAVKPSIGLPLLVAWPSRPALIGSIGLVVVALIALPHWPIAWLDALRDTPQYRAPVLRPGGFLLLLAFLRWRQPEARMLGTLALIPHTTGIYEWLPLLLIPQNKKRFAAMFGLTYLAAACAYAFTPHGPAVVAEGLDAQWPYFFVLVYAPALYMVLSRSAPGTRSPILS